MKALTLWQPWAWLVACGAKQVETRDWSTKYRGRLAIHAAKNRPYFLGLSAETPVFRNEITRVMREQNCANDHDLLDVGVVLCTVDLVAIELAENTRDDLSQRERIFGRYDASRYAWFFENLQRLAAPIPAIGNRRLWNWEPPA